VTDGDEDGDVLGLPLAPGIDGLALGISLAASVGELDEATLGCMDGDFEEVNVGVEEVVIDGESDGAKLGELDSAMLGFKEGKNEGNCDAMIDGEIDGELLDFLDGDGVGASVDSASKLISYESKCHKPDDCVLFTTVTSRNISIGSLEVTTTATAVLSFPFT
jgi:hypothetical protein